MLAERAMVPVVRIAQCGRCGDNGLRPDGSPCDCATGLLRAADARKHYTRTQIPPIGVGGARTTGEALRTRARHARRAAIAKLAMRRSGS